MIYPLSWLSEYVTLPKDLAELTNRLTMAGHMLDKIEKKGDETIIDLELRGNRPDLLGVYGLAREISALYNLPLKGQEASSLTKLKSTETLVTVKAPELVERFFALTLSVKVKPSPDWLKKRLNYFGIPSINNVVDITNYVMLETGEPMHAFDFNKLSGNHLVLRRAKAGEQMTTLFGTILTLSPEDLVLSDDKIPQGLTMIGGQNSGTTESTTEILLEAAVYKYANVRRTGRRLGVRTEAGTRHEKILDPNTVEQALGRAVKLLEDLAEAKPLGQKTDFYPNVVSPTEIVLPKEKIHQLTGVEVPLPETKKILSHLGAEIKKETTTGLVVKAPSFRTDLKDPADLVEEVIRVYGYQKIPVEHMPLNHAHQNKFSKQKYKEELRDQLVNHGLNEVITLSIIENSQIKEFEVGGQYPKVATIINPPDANIASLRPSLIPGLVNTVKKAQEFKQPNLSFFEIGKVFYQTKTGEYQEEDRVALVIGILNLDQLSYTKTAGVVRAILETTGQKHTQIKTSDIPSFDPDTVAEIISDKKSLGFVGLLNPNIVRSLKLSADFLIAELSIDRLFTNKKPHVRRYSRYPSFPSIYEDLTVTVSPETNLDAFTQEIKALSKLINDIRLIGIYENSRTFTIIYEDRDKSISNETIKPIREKIEHLATEKYKLVVK